MQYWQIGLCMGASLLLGNLASAEAVQVKTPAPVIHLADNLDEADGLGWCIDTVGRGFADTLHTHSCKPQGGDVQFSFDPASGAIRSVAFEGKCMQVGAVGAATDFALVDCDSARSEQQFTFDSASGDLRPKDTPQSCVVVGESSQSAGPFMSRSLNLEACEAVAENRRRWVIQP